MPTPKERSSPITNQTFSLFTQATKEPTKEPKELRVSGPPPSLESLPFIRYP